MLIRPECIWDIIIPAHFLRQLKLLIILIDSIKNLKFYIHNEFEQIYATAKDFSWTNEERFRKFCSNVNIKCQSLSTEPYFKHGMCDGAFSTKEYTYDAMILKRHLLNQICNTKNVDIMYN